MSDETILQSKVPAHQTEKYLLDYLCARFKYQSKDSWFELIKAGKVSVNGEKASPYHPLKKGDLVAYSVVLKEPPVDGHIEIVHEEPTFLVAVKSGKLPSHADGNFIKKTFIYLITERLRAAGWTGEVKLVHRLDRETSGLMVVAKDKEAHRKLTEQFEKGLVEKEYLAVVKGTVTQEKFQVEGAIGRDEASQISVRQKVVPPETPFAKPALTLFEKIQDLKETTLLRCLPKTGRTNQIRVHLAHAGHPIVGDKLYGRTDEEFLSFIQHVKAGGDPAFDNRFETARHLLHAGKLTFAHPATGEKLTYEVAPPADFQDFIKNHSL